MKPTNLPNKHCLFVCLFIGVFFSIRSYAQITILTPTLDFTQACASADFNEYQVTFSFYPAQNLGADNEFLIELSDASGSFSAPVVLKSLTNTTSPVREKFAMPETVSGDNYKIRIRSTTPEFISPATTAFSAHYAIHNQPFSINSYDSSVTLCQGESYTLQIDNNNTAASPMYYPELKYIWYRNFSEITGETSSALTVSETGSYYCIVDYGDCVMDSYSNIVDVNVISDIIPEITSDNNSNALCAGSTTTLTSNIQDSNYTYTWFKDDVALTNSNTSSYTVSEPGTYVVSINMGGNCDFLSNKLTIATLDFDITINNGEENLLLIPGNTLNLSTNTSANSPTFTWYKNDVEITGQSESDILVSDAGIYKVIATQSEPCVIEKEASITVVNPLYYELEIVSDASYEACNSTETTLSINAFDAITNDSNIDLIGSTQSYAFQWYKNNEAISGATGTTLSITNASENGDYTLDIALTDNDTAISNTLAISLSAETITITNDKGLCDNQEVTFTANVANTSYNYQWYKDNNAISGATSHTFSTTEAGAYYLEVTSANCTINSNTVALVNGGINISSTTPETDILLPGETKTITIETDATNPTFTWYKDDVLILGATANQLTATEVGTYKVIVAQTEGCITEVSKTFEITAPSDFTATVANENFKSCATDIMTISLTSLMANTDSSTIDLLQGDLTDYTFQWYKDNVIVNQANTLHLDVTDPADNGNYHVVATVPNFGEITSNTIPVHLTTIKNVSIETADSFCNTSSTVTISTTVETSDSITFAWYKEGESEIIDTAQNITVNEAGTYYLEVSDGDCVISSNYLEVKAFDDSMIATNYPAEINLVSGTSLTITAEGAEAYSWSLNGETLSTTNEVLISEAGTYTLTASINTCETTKLFTVTEVENNAITIPNTVTLNGDGFNDTWALPNQYVNNSNVEVLIYKADGSIAFKGNNYMNNWPEQNYKFSNKSPVFYYVILENGKATKKGSITIIK